MRDLVKYFSVVFLLLTVFTGLSAAQGASTQLEADVLKTEPVPLQAGEYADVWIRVTNTGDVAAEDPRIEALESFPFTPVDKSEWRPTGGLVAGQSYDIRVKLRVDENAVFGQNELKLRLSGSGDTSFTESIPLEVRTDDRSLVVSDLDFPEKAGPGSSGEMNITLENMANSNFRNIDVRLDVEGLPVAPEETSRKRISSIGPKESVEASFTLNVDPDAENELYQLPIIIEYQNQAGQEFSVTETTGVNVGGYPNIEVAMDESDIRSSGSGSATFRVINRGEGEARFAEVSLAETEQYEILSENSIYLGSMIADDYQTAEFELFVEASNGTVKFPVTVEYRDGEGSSTEKFIIERELYTEDQLQRYGLQQSGSALPAVVVLLLILGGLYYWRRLD